MIKHVFFFPEIVAKQIEPLNNVALISISDGYKVELKNWGIKLLRLYFHDLSGPLEGYVHFKRNHAIQILKFLKYIEAFEHQVDTIYVHCHAGISRSAGVALFIADKYDIKKFNRKRADLYNRLVYSTLMKVDNAGVVQ